LNIRIHVTHISLFWGVYMHFPIRLPTLHLKRFNAVIPVNYLMWTIFCPAGWRERYPQRVMHDTEYFRKITYLKILWSVFNWPGCEGKWSCFLPRSSVCECKKRTSLSHDLIISCLVESVKPVLAEQHAIKMDHFQTDVSDRLNSEQCGHVFRSSPITVIRYLDTGK
jgi:hypothetical protein